MVKYNYRSDLKTKARTLRSNPTPAEQKLWHDILSRRRLADFRFLRQKPISLYIVDFYCPSLKLVIEIDGDSHGCQSDYDTKRTKVLNDLGIKVVRYTNTDVLTNIEGIYDDLLSLIKHQTK